MEEVGAPTPTAARHVCTINESSTMEMVRLEVEVPEGMAPGEALAIQAADGEL